MIRPAIAATLIALLAAAPAFADDIACAGVFGPNATLKSLEKHFGKANVVTGEVPGPEGTTMVATTVFPNDPDKSFQVFWFDEEKHERLATFTVPANATAPGGLKVGMGIKEVEKLNGEPFTLYGFYWDYGGAAGFTSGKLSDLPGGCHVNVTFAPSIEPTGEAISDAVSGDKEIRSDLKALDAVKPVITEIGIGYPDPMAVTDGTAD